MGSQRAYVHFQTRPGAFGVVWPRPYAHFQGWSPWCRTHSVVNRPKCPSWWWALLSTDKVAVHILPCVSPWARGDISLGAAGSKDRHTTILVNTAPPHSFSDFRIQTFMRASFKNTRSCQPFTSLQTANLYYLFLHFLVIYISLCFRKPLQPPSGGVCVCLLLVKRGAYRVCFLTSSAIILEYLQPTLSM